MSQGLSRRAAIVSVAKGHREMLTVTVLRETADALRRVADLREAVNRGGHAAQNVGEAIDDAVAHALTSGHWNDF